MLIKTIMAGWIQKISDGIEKALNFARPALVAIPPLLLVCEVHSRPGLSAMSLASAIIGRLNEAGIETGVNPDGSPNKINSFVRIISEEIVNEIKENALIQCVVEPGSIIGTGTGVSPTGPVTVSTINTMVSNLFGIIR